MQSITIGPTASKYRGNLPIVDFLKELDEREISYCEKKDMIRSNFPFPYYEIYIDSGINKEEIIELVKKSEYRVILA